MLETDITYGPDSLVRSTRNNDSSLFQKDVAIRVDAKGQLSHSHRCHFDNDCQLPRPVPETPGAHRRPGWLKQAIEFCKSYTTHLHGWHIQGN